METLYKKHKMLIAQTSMDIVRDILYRISWEKPLVGIRGSRGVGKTTLMRQYVKSNYGIEPGEALYCVMDSIYFTDHSLLDMAEKFHLRGGRHLFLDEVHKYENWSKEIKEISDLYPDMKITFTGSSLLQILNADADLSRRVLSYDMAGLSLREFLRFYHNIEIPCCSLKDILTNADDICKQVNRVCSPQKAFEEYVEVGYYPFYDGCKEEYYSRLENVVQFIIDQEMTLLCGVEPAYTRRLKAMLLFLANNNPYEVNINKLATYLGLNRVTVLNYLASMKRAELLHLIYSDNKSVTKMQKPDKIYVHNPNILCALANEKNTGTLRETFFVNQMSVKHSVEYGKQQGDFLIDGKYTIEIGGPGKTFDQIANLPDSYIMADNMDSPLGKKLPLWMAGLMY